MEKKQKITTNDFVNIMDYFDEKYPFQFFVGGRGNGKTYSCIQSTVGLNPKHNVSGKFMLFRRTPTEWENMMLSNPYKKINEDNNVQYDVQNISKTVGGVYHTETDEASGKQICIGNPIGYTAPMLSVSKVRSTDFSDVNYIFYDEFIPEEHTRLQKGEGAAFLNAYETINRNREMFGEPPVYLFACSNSENIDNAIFRYLHIVDDLEKMMSQGISDKYYPNRSMAVHLLKSSKKFVEAKSMTALYKMAAGTDFVDMAINNKFVANDFSYVGYKSVKGYQPWIALSDMYVWHKPSTGELYCTYTPARCKKLNEKNSIDCQEFKRTVRLYSEGRLLKGLMYFETYALKTRFLDICNLFK